MSYISEQKTRRKKTMRFAAAALFLGVIFFFRLPIYSSFSSAAHFVFRPVLSAGASLSRELSLFRAYLSSKNALLRQNEELERKLESSAARTAAFEALLLENVRLKETLGRRGGDKKMILAAVLSGPARSPYGTLVLDVGTGSGIRPGQGVFAYGSVPIGTIREVSHNSAKVVLYSSPGEKTEVVLSGSDVFAELVGRGGGNFEMFLPRDFPLSPGTEALLPGISARVVARAVGPISDPRDALRRELFISPVNTFSLRYVEVELSE